MQQVLQEVAGGVGRVYLPIYGCIGLMLHVAILPLRMSQSLKELQIQTLPALCTGACNGIQSS